MTPAQARRSQAFDFVWKLLWDYRRVPEEYYVSSAGYRILLLGVIMVCMNSASIVAGQKISATAAAISQSIGMPVQPSQPQVTPVPPGKSARQPVYVPQGQTTAPQPPPPQVPLPSNPKDRVPFFENGTYYNLLERDAPRVIPDPRWFSVDRLDFLGTTSDGVSYYRFDNDNEGQLLRSLNLHGRNSCLIVPKGSVGYINAAYPPKYVYNMGDEILVGIMSGEPTHRPRNQHDTPDSFWMINMNWKQLHDSWGSTHQQFGRVTSTSNGASVVPFFVRGLPKDTALSEDKPTGLICF